jgi:hypothetical protein
MSDALQRTIRRCTAVLAIPLSLYPLVFVARLETDGYQYMNAVLRAADEVAAVVFLGAVVYLIGSVLAEAVRTDPRPEESTAADRTD